MQFMCEFIDIYKWIKYELMQFYVHLLQKVPLYTQCKVLLKAIAVCISQGDVSTSFGWSKHLLHQLHLLNNQTSRGS